VPLMRITANISRIAYKRSDDWGFCPLSLVHFNPFGEYMLITKAPNPYRDDGSEIIILPLGGCDMWLDAKTLRPVQFGVSAVQTSVNDTSEVVRLPIKELRNIAVSWANAVSPKPLTVLHPLEDNRRGKVYYFRWDDFSAHCRDSELPPFIQIALSPSGKILSFTNTMER
jgi:hypothetical protein